MRVLSQLLIDICPMLGLVTGLFAYHFIQQLKDNRKFVRDLEAMQVRHLCENRALVMLFIGLLYEYETTGMRHITFSQAWFADFNKFLKAKASTIQ